MKNRLMKLMALITVMVLTLGVSAYATEDTTLSYDLINFTNSADFAAATDLKLGDGSGVCEVDVQLQQVTGGTLSFSKTSDTNGKVTAVADSNYVFKGLRYRVVEGVDNVDDNWGSDPDTYEGGFAVAVTEANDELGLVLSRVANKPATAHLETEFIIVVTADFVETSQVTIDPTIYELTVDGSNANVFTENEDAGYLLITNVTSDGTLIKTLDDDNKGESFTETLEIGTKVQFEYFAKAGFEDAGWKYDYSHSTPRTNPRTKNISSGTESFGPTPVFKAVAEQPPTEVQEVVISVATAGTGSGTVSVSGGGQGPATSITVPVGTLLTFVATEASGSVFVDWDEEPAAASVTATYTATFNTESTPETPEEPETPETPSNPTPTPAPVVTYDLIVSATEGGTVPGFIGTKTFNDGTVVNLGPVAEEGYEFTGWTGDTSSDQVTMNSDKSVTANFELIVEEEEIPEAPLPEAPVEEEEVILDEELTEAAPSDVIEDEALPQTGGIPISAMSMMGLALSGLGVKLRKKK